MHQIGWLVTDGCGRAEGVGSRFFSVLNGASAGALRPSVANDALVITAGTASAGRPDSAAWSAGSDQTVGAQLTAPPQDSVPAARPSSTPLAAIMGSVAVRHEGSDWQDVQEQADAGRVVEMHQGGRIEVQLPPVTAGEYAGYQEVAGRPRPLPLGSSVDAKAGIFYWQPDSAFLGPFDLVFEATGGETVRLRVVVK
jgi:hypothetical protein